jgi:hypothetical protein
MLTGQAFSHLGMPAPANTTVQQIGLFTDDED